MDDEQIKKEKKKYLHSLIDKLENEEDTDAALEKMIQLAKSFN